MGSLVVCDAVSLNFYTSCALGTEAPDMRFGYLLTWKDLVL